jgi:DNA-binding transcriptional LysR family regulator
MDRLDAMRAFARVVEVGSFTKAADSLHLNKAAITLVVQQLEARLRVRLLHRTTRRVGVTAEGAAYYERVQRILADVEEAETALTNANVLPKGRLRVDAPGAFARSFLMPAAAHFLQRYPDLELELGCSDRAVDMLHEGVDCVVRAGELRDSSLVARRVGSFDLVTCASPAYIARKGMPCSTDALEEHEFVAYVWANSGRARQFRFIRGASQIELLGRHRIALNDTHAYLSAGLQGLGLLQIADFVAQPHIERAELVRVLPDWHNGSLPLHVVYPPNRHLSSKVRVFVEWVQELLSAHVQPPSACLPLVRRDDVERGAASGD